MFDKGYPKIITNSNIILSFPQKLIQKLGKKIHGLEFKQRPAAKLYYEISVIHTFVIYYILKSILLINIFKH